MAAIDKVYITWETYCKFKEWCEKQPPLYDKYGKKTYLKDWLWDCNEEKFIDENGKYSVKYLTPVASGYIVLDGDTSNPIQVTSTEMVLDGWDIGLHHVQVYTGETNKVSFKGFLLEQ